MKISKKDAVALLIALGFDKAGEWDDEKLAGRIGQVPSKARPEDIPENHKELFEQLSDADTVEIVAAVENDADEEGADADGEEGEEEEEVKPKKKDKKKNKTERAVDLAAAKTKRTGKEKAAKDKAAAAKNKKPARAERETDEFGNDPNSIRGKVNKALSEEWQTAEEIAKASGVTLKQARSRLRRAARKGLVEVERLVQYRFASKKRK